MTHRAANNVTADLENWNGTDRFHFNAIVSDQDLIEVACTTQEAACCFEIITIPFHFFCTLQIQTYFPAFEACVREGHAVSIMCSYNAVNGVPSCANGAIQNDIVRKQWGFGGFFVS